MLRYSRRLAEHVQSSAQYISPVYYKSNPNSFWAKRWRNFSQRGGLGKFFTVCGYCAGGIGAYLATCLVVRTVHQPTVDALFTSGEDYTLEEWRTVEPTLRPGDIILMRGNGLMSWTIATLQFIYSFMHPAGLRYSHVAVVVAPAVVEYVDEATYEANSETVPPLPPPYKVERLEDVFAEVDPVVSAQHARPAEGSSTVAACATAATGENCKQTRDGKGTPSVHAQLQAEESALRRRPVVRRGAIILEAMDNKDYDIPDVTGKVTYDTVQVVEASRRIFSTTAENAPAYKYFSVRRLQNFEHTPEQQEKIKRFCLESEGRKMDGSLLYPLAFLYAKLHTLTHPLRSAVSGEVSCSELIVELYQELGVIERHWRWVAIDPSASPAVPAATAALATLTRGESNEANEDEILKNTLNATTAAAVAEEGKNASLPTPTQADATHDRSAKSLHVYDYVYGRVNDRVRKPVMSRDRPALPDASTVENGEVLAAPQLRLRSAMAPLKPVWPELDARRDFNDFFGNTLAGDAAEAARQKLKTRMAASFARNPDVPTLPLRAGDVAEGVDGSLYQLQWYYKHNSIATCPYHFTEGKGESVLDFAMNVGLGPEIFMHIDRPGDSTRWILEDE